MELNTAERFPLLDADVANTFTHLSSMCYYRKVEEGTNLKQPPAFQKVFSFYITKVK